jgi:hypothetical protein
MAQLQHDNDGFLQGERVNLDTQTEFLESISKDISAIKTALTENKTITPVQPVERTESEAPQVAEPRVTHIAEATTQNPVTQQAQSQSPEISSERAVLASLESAAQSLNGIQIDLSSTANSLKTISTTQQESKTVKNETAKNEKRPQQTGFTPNVGTNNNSVGDGNSDNSTPQIKLRDDKGRFIAGTQGGRKHTDIAEPQKQKNRDANGRFSSGENGGLGKGRGGEAGFISRLASGIGSAVGAGNDVVDEKIDPAIAVFKEVAEPIARVGGAALNVGKTLFSGAKSVVNFLPKFKGKDSESESKEKTATPTANVSPATQEVRTPPARISETTTVNPQLRTRDSRGRFVSANQPVSQPSSRQTGSNLVQNNPPQSGVVEPSRNTIFGTNAANPPTETNATQTAQPEPHIAETSQRGFFSRSNSSSQKEKGGKLSLRGVIKELLVSRKEQTAYNKASKKLLQQIANKETVAGGDSGGGFFAGLLGGLIPTVVAGLGALVAGVVAVFTGIGGMLLAGVTGVLGVIFSPIGLAIAAAGALAWGLFTEDGQKFFASIGEYISKGWDASVGFITENFSGVVDTANAFWNWLTEEFSPITKVAGDLFDGLTKTWKGITDTISGIFDSFSTFLKDKFGIDIPAIVQTVVQPVADAANAAVDSVKETANNVADSAKNAATNLWEGAKKVAGEAVEATKDVVNPAYEGVKKSVKDGAVLKDTATGVKDVAGGIGDFVTKKYNQAKFNEVDAALAFQGGGNITGLSDIQTRALAANTAKTESGGKVNADNKQGYFGQYQFGAEALVESGLVNQDKLAAAKKASGKNWYKKRSSDGTMGGHEAFLRDKSNWKTEGGLDEFLQNKELQDKAFVAYTNKNVAGGLRSGAISKNDDAGKIAGYSKAAHLKGVGGANKLFKSGIASTDGNGTSTATYAKQASNAMNETVAAINAKVAKGEKPTETQTASAKPIEAESTLEKLSPISTASASEIPANTGAVAPEIAAQMHANESVKNVNSALIDGTQKAMDKGVKYNYGSKNSSNGTIDCSGWVTELNNQVFNDMGKPEVLKKSMAAVNSGQSAAGIIKSVGDLTGKELSGKDVNIDNLKEGMMIGIDHSQGGEKSGEGRYKGIDHITQVVKDQVTGALQISESSSKKGVHLTDAKEWLDRNKDKEKYAVDPYAAVRDVNGTDSTIATTKHTENAAQMKGTRQADALSQYAKTGKFTPVRNDYGDGSDLTPEQMASVQKYNGGDTAQVGVPTGLSVDESGVYSDIPTDNSPESIAARKLQGEKARETSANMYKPKDSTATVTASAVNPAEKVIENTKPDSPIIADIKQRLTPQADIAAQLAKNTAPATNSIKGIGDIGGAITNQLPSFLSNPISAITKSISMPSAPKMPSMPVIAEAPPVKEPLNSNEPRQTAAVSQQTQDVGQDMSDKRLSHIVSGGYARG